MKCTQWVTAAEKETVFKTKGKVCLKLRAMIVAKFKADFSFKT
jgi:hypothetical protein